MSITSRTLEALFKENNDLWLDVGEIKRAAIQEIIMYYAYHRSMGNKKI